MRQGEKKEGNTCGEATTEQGHVPEGDDSGVHLHHASRIQHRVLAKRRRIEEVEDGFSVFTPPEPALSVAGHHLLHRVYPEILTHVRPLRSAEDTLLTLTVEYRHHVVPARHVTHSLPYALDYSAPN